MAYQAIAKHGVIPCACASAFKEACPACYGRGAIAVAYSPAKTSGEMLTDETRQKLIEHIVTQYGAGATGRLKFAKAQELHDQTVHRALCCGAVGFQTARKLFQVIEPTRFAMMPNTRPTGVLLSNETMERVLDLCDKILSTAPGELTEEARSLKEQLLREKSRT